MASQLYQLSRRFPDKYVGKKGTRGDKFINHAIIKQRLLEVCGGYDFKVVREIFDGETLTGCVGELTVVIDNNIISVQEYGALELPQENNGANAKHCASDAFKRCAMHIGLGLHVWIDEQYFLESKLAKATKTSNEVDLETSTNGGGTSNSETPATSVIKDQVDGSSTLSDSTDINDVNDDKTDEPPAQKTELDKKLERIKKEIVENAKENKIDPRTGGKITYKHDK